MMNVASDNIIVNSCEYTPVYLIPNPGVAQGSYILTQSNLEPQRPLTDNLKRFYENSGNLETNVLTSPKPRILKKQTASTIGNNLKLASFLLPKEPVESTNTQYVPQVSNVVYQAAPKPVVTTVSTNVTNTVNLVPKVEVDRKIVRVGSIPLPTRSTYTSRMVPKTKPKEIPVQNPSKHTSVQLLKLGETYHSLNQLSDEQMKIVNQALKYFSDHERIPKEPAYDPVTNTKFIYKIVSPRDLTVVGKNKVAMKQKKNDIRKHAAKKDPLPCPHLLQSESLPLTHTLKKDSVTSPHIFKKDTLQSPQVLMSDSIQSHLLKKDQVPLQHTLKKDPIPPSQMLKREPLLSPNILKKDSERFKKDQSPHILKKDSLTSQYSLKKDMLASSHSLKKDSVSLPHLTKKDAIPTTHSSKKNEQLDEELEEESSTVEHQKVTRSGRTVKLPKQMRPDKETPQKPRKKSGNIVTCFQCSAEFCSLYRLQRHYESNPTHIPAKTHTNLFHCLLAIIKGGSNEDQANIFLQQLEQLIEKLKTLLPCLIKEIDGCEGKMCTINDDIGRLFGMDPGKYHLNMNALNCVKDKDGHCIHNPAPKNNQFNADMSKPSQLWLSKHNEEIANEAETEDCARINSVDKWPTVSKRIWKYKQQKAEDTNAKRMRLTSENNEQVIELGTDDVASCIGKDDTVNILQNANNCQLEEKNDEEHAVQRSIDNNPVAEQIENHKTRMQFHSAHFDIRSSPIKLPSALVRKFQINSDNLSKYEVQIMRPLALDCPSDNDNDIDLESSTDVLQEIFRENDLEKASDINEDLTFDSHRIWPPDINDDQSNDTYLKSNMLFGTGLTPIKNNNLIEPSLLHMKDNPNSLFESSSKHENLIESSLIPKSNGVFEPSLMHFKDKGLFDPPDSVKSESQMIEATLMEIQESSNLYEPSLISLRDKSNIMFEAALSHVKERSNNLFESTIHTKNKNSLIGQTSICITNKPELFDTNIEDRKDNNSLIESTMMHMKDKSDPLIDAGLLHIKDDKCTENIDMNQSEHLNTNDNRLMSNQGQCVLNFLESLGNELAYPETEIRNNSVDFQLDLFSFTST